MSVVLLVCNLTALLHILACISARTQDASRADGLHCGQGHIRVHAAERTCPCAAQITFYVCYCGILGAFTPLPQAVHSRLDSAERMLMPGVLSVPGLQCYL